MIYLELEFSVNVIPREVLGTHSLFQQGDPVQGHHTSVQTAQQYLTSEISGDWDPSHSACHLISMHKEGIFLIHPSEEESFLKKLHTKAGLL